MISLLAIAKVKLLMPSEVATALSGPRFILKITEHKLLADFKKSKDYCQGRVKLRLVVLGLKAGNFYENEAYLFSPILLLLLLLLLLPFFLFFPELYGSFLRGTK